ncbi:hypothetical protein IGI96_003534 [Enterococcus sp. DIV0421]|uniref:MurR/RpiR family transcriptional regulator n=1 Tax=Enterococcus sp. DIV0421 TaxID=2774688 RepID=UPI003F271203
MQRPVNLILKIQTQYNQFTKAEKKIADYVLSYKENIIYMSITELANVCAVGETSVYRFCRTMEFGGYQEFKMELSLYLASNRTENIEKENQEFRIEKERMKRQIDAVEETYQLLDMRSIIRVVEMMEEANSIFFFGVGGSAQTAQDFWSKFLRITSKVRIIQDAHLQAMATSLLTEKDLVFLVSYSGATKDIVNIADIAKGVNAHVVGITRYQKSPLTKYTDEILLCGSKESPLEGGSLTVKTSQIYLLDLLYTIYYKRNKESSIKNQHKSSQAVVDKLF